MTKPNPILQLLRTLPIRLDSVFFMILNYGRMDGDFLDRMRVKTFELRSQNLLKDALRMCNRAISLSPSNYAILHVLGDVLDDLGRTDEALADYSQSLALRMQLHPDDPDTFYYRGFYYSYIGKYEDAIADFNRALTFNNNEINVLHNRALAYGKLKLFADALEDFDRVCELQPDGILALEERAKVNCNLNNNEAVVRDILHINSLVAPDRKHLYRQALLLLALRNLQQFDQALDVCDQILSFVPDNAQAFASKAHILYMLRRFDEALIFRNRAVELSPDDLEIRSNRVTLLYDLGYLSEALSDANFVLVQQPDNIVALSMRALLHARDGQLEKGRQDLVKGKALDPSAPIVCLAEAAYLSLEDDPYAALNTIIAVEATYPWAWESVMDDPLFSNLRSLPEWQAYIATKSSPDSTLLDPSPNNLVNHPRERRLRRLLPKQNPRPHRPLPQLPRRRS